MRSPQHDLRTTALHILHCLRNTKNVSTATPYLHPSVSVQHDENEPTVSRENNLNRWASISAAWPELQAEVQEAVVDESQSKVWVLSELSGLPDGMVKTSVDMLTFEQCEQTGRWVCVKCADVQRVARRGTERRKKDKEEHGLAWEELQREDF